MKPVHLLAGLLCLLLAGCGANGFTLARADVEVAIENKSSHDLENAEAIFGEYTCEAGIVGKTFTAIYLSYPHPITADTELHWNEGAKHRVERIDLRKIYPSGKSGRLTFTVYDGRVETSFKEEQ
jgi:hypothetical protein